MSPQTLRAMPQTGGLLCAVSGIPGRRIQLLKYRLRTLVTQDYRVAPCPGSYNYLHNRGLYMDQEMARGAL